MLGMILKSREHWTQRCGTIGTLEPLEPLVTISCSCLPSENIAPSSGTGRTWRSRRSRPPRNWPRSIPICTRRCSGRAICRFRSRWCSRRSTGANYERALEKARASAEYLETGEGANRRHRARFFSSDALRAARPVRARRPGAGHRGADRRSPRPVLARAVAAAALVSPAATDRAWRPRNPNSTSEMITSRPRSGGSRPSSTCSSPAACRGRRGKRARGSRRSSRRHDQSFIRNTADRFRFESLQNRYAKFIELWERQMTNRELGRPDAARRQARRPKPPPASRGAPRSAKATAPPGEPRRDGRRSSARSPSDPRTTEPTRARSCIEQLAEAKKQVGEAPVRDRSRRRAGEGAGRQVRGRTART